MIAGVDGCKSGWIVARAAGWPCAGAATVILCETFRAVLEATAACDVVVVDIPIGLPEGAAVRKCDVAAQETLASARARVFLAPPRSALTAPTAVDFQARHRALRGRGAGVPLWRIVPKIVEVDAAMTPVVQARVMEFHPELAWRRLAGRTLVSKHGGEGLRARTALVPDALPPLETLRGRLGHRAALDDVLDAIVGLPVAHAIAAHRGRRLPAAGPDVDARGLRMEIWY